MFLNKKTRILECIRQGQIGGGESHLLSLMENLNKDIFEPVVLSFTNGPMIKRLQIMGIRTYIIHTERPFDISKWTKVKKLLQDEKIDIVHAHGTRANSNVFWAAKSLRLPLIYTIHGWSFHNNQNPLIKKIRILSEKFLTRKATINISVSKSNQQTGNKYIPGFNSVVINNGIDQGKFNPNRSFRDIRTELGIKKNSILLLFIARFTTHKQPLVLIRAFAVALKELPHLKLLMVGEGDEKVTALKITKELGIQDQVVFQSFREDVPDILSAADIFILPSLWEGLPIGLLEAMSMGKAIIATNVDGTSEIVDHLFNGLLLDLNNLNTELPKAILLLAHERDLREKFKVNAMEIVKNRFNATVMTKQLENIYSDLIK